MNAAPGTVSMTGDASSGSPYAAVCAWKRHWPDYLKEAAGLMIFMLGAGAFTTLFEHPGSPVRMAISSDLARHVALGCVMGLVTAGIIYSPWGQRSGAHINPAVTWSFYRLGKIDGWDATFIRSSSSLAGCWRPFSCSGGSANPLRTRK